MVPPANLKTSQSLRIAMLSLHSSPGGDLGTRNTGGMSVVVRSLARCLGASGHCVDIFTCRDRGTAIDLGDHVSLIQLPEATEGLSKEQLPDHIEQMYSWMENHARNNGIRYDILHSHYWISGLAGALARDRWQIPHVIMFHTLGWLKNKYAPGEDEPRRRIREERRLTAGADHIIAPTDHERRQLLRYYHADPRRISVLPYGVDLDFFGLMDGRLARRRLDLPHDAPVLLFVGRFVPLKGLDRLIDALARLLPRHPEMVLVLVGGDDGNATTTRDLRQQAVRRKLGRHIRFAGRVPHPGLVRYYAAADLLVLPSQYESFGLVVTEALACGLPVAATPVGAAGQLIREGHTGVLFEGFAAGDIAAGIDRLLSLVKAKQLPPESIRSSVTAMTWERVSTRVEEIYRHVLKNRSLKES